MKAYQELEHGGNGDDSLTVGNLIVDKTSKTASKDGLEIHLTSAEFDLLWVLAMRAGEVVSRDELFGRILGMDYNGLDRTMDVRVSRLRRKLGDNGNHPRMIKSVRCEGYCMVVANGSSAQSQV